VEGKLGGALAASGASLWCEQIQPAAVVFSGLENRNNRGAWDSSPSSPACYSAGLTPLLRGTALSVYTSSRRSNNRPFEGFFTTDSVAFSCLFLQQLRGEKIFRESPQVPLQLLHARELVIALENLPVERIPE